MAGLAAILLSLGVGLLVWFLWEPPQAPNLTHVEKRFLHGPPNPRDKFQQNSWWRYANYTAHARNQSNCYVCAHLPTSTTHHGGRAYDIDSDLLRCLLGLATHPGNGVSPLRANFSLPFNHSRSPLHGHNCSQSRHVVPWPQLRNPLVLTDVVHTHNHSLCVAGNGSVPVGDVDPDSCARIVTFCRYLNVAAFLSCIRDTSCGNNATRFAVAKRRVQADSIWYSRYACSCSGTSPTSLGTRVLADFFFLCGASVYASLPPHWGGLCTIVFYSEPLIVIPKADLNEHPVTRLYRPKRDLLLNRGVPYDHRIWGKGTMLGYALFPQSGIPDIMREIMYGRYQLLRFLESSTAIMNATGEELSALRLTVLQHRMVLDLSLAGQGGVCAVVGEACCTYIPDHSGAGGVIVRELGKLTALRDEVRNSMAHQDFDWWSWLTTGSWMSILLKALLPLIAVTLFVCLLCGCVVPCLRRAMERAVIGVVSVHYQRLHLQDHAPDLFPVPDYDSDDDDGPL